MWLLTRIHGSTPALHERGGAWLDGPVDAALLRATIAALALRHESLRTTFVEREGRPLQSVSPEPGVDFREVELGDGDADDADERAQAVAREEVSRPFDLERGPLFRVCSVRFTPRRRLLVLTMHHLISDGDRSVGLVFRELFLRLRAQLEGSALDLRAPGTDYREHADRQRTPEARERMAQQLEFWRTALADAPTALELPVDRPRPALQTFAGGAVARAIEPALARELRAFAAREGTTPQALIFAGLLALLHRMSGQDDVLVGTPLPGRDASEEAVIGYFGNPVVIRGRFADDPSFCALAARTAATHDAASLHGEVSFSRVVEAIAPPRDLGRPPLFQLLYSARERWPAPLKCSALTLTLTDVALPFVAYEQIVTVQESDETWALSLEYAQALFDADTRASFLERWELLLRAALARPDAPVSSLAIVTAPERRTLVDEWGAAAREYPRDASIHALFAACAAATPDAIAAVCGEEQITYGALDRRANRLARRLIAGGVSPGASVGVFIERSVEVLVVLLAILKAGGAYVPLDPEYPVERLRRMLASSGASVLISPRAAAASLGFAGVVVDVAEDARDDTPTTDPGVEVAATDLAYIMFTSGSTGQPKAVGVPHRAVVRLCVGTNYQEIRPDDRVMHAASLSFDGSTYEIYSALLHGARLVLLEKDALLVPEVFAARLQRDGITAMFLTTAVFNQLVRADPSMFRAVRSLMVGGEAADPRLMRAVLERGAPERLLNAYGPTENTGYSTCHWVREVPDGAPSVPIGLPIANSSAHVLDRRGELVPPGVIGELHVGGDGLAWGYLGDPARTAEKFVPDPFAREPGARLYRTGDRVRRLPDGAIDFVGRVDHQVKIRGFRVEPGEVEALLAERGDVRQAAVIVREDAPGDRRLVAYVVPAEAEPPAPAALRAYLGERLPAHTIPAAFVRVAALPLTPNGKLDVRALPAPGAHHLDLPEQAAAPRSEIEDALVSLWQELLGLERVGVHDDFFALGGHSLRAAQIVSWIGRRYRVALSLREFFGGPTVAGLAARIEATRATLRPAHAIAAAPRGAVAPLSFAQERLWFIHQIAPASRAYHYPAYFRLRGRLDGVALERALQALVGRHESLRTSFAELAGEPVQVIAAEPRFGLATLDLGAAADRDAALAGQLAAEADRGFDLRHGPLIRATLLRLADDDHALLLSLHHIVTDGWSMNVLYRELAALYAAFADGAAPTLAPLPIQFADVALWQRRAATEPAHAEQLSWWKQRLAGAPLVLDLPADRPRPSAPSFAGGSVPLRLGRAATDALRSLAAAEGATPFMVLLAGLFELLRRFTGQEDILVGTPHAGRGAPETEGLIGFFVNTLVIRGELAGDLSFRALIRRVRDASVEAYDHADLPFERLVAAIDPGRTASRNPLVQVMFAPQVSALGQLRLPGVDVEALAPALDKSTCDLTWFVWDAPDGIGGLLEYSADLFERATIERLAGHLGALLRAAVAAPDTDVSRLPLLPDDERRALVSRWNATRRDYPRDASLAGLFAAQVERRPDALAVVDGDDSITYAALDRRANRIARWLVARGVGRDVAVGVLGERSIAVVAAILGVVKAGGAYVPLDPEHPRERLAGMLADAGASVLIAPPELAGPLAFAGAVLDPALGAGEDLPADAPARASAADDLAYVMFTSGSTGRPKGVAVPQRAVVRLVVGTDYVAFTPDDRVMLAANLAFDASTFELWGALLHGACLVVVDRGTSLSPERFAARVRRAGVTVMFLSTALFHVLARTCPEVFAGVGHLVVGGDALDPGAAREVLAAGPPRRLVNGYGPTENTTFSTAHRVRDVAPDAASVPIGRPIANSTAYVLDPHGEPVPIGFPGELHVGGDGVARGYVGRPELTASRFLADPFRDAADARMYRTGDRARQRADGTIEFLGRLDRQVKIRGFRIEPGEVEVALREHPGVREAAVVVREEAGERRLVAYVAAAEALELAALRERLRARLPAYMLPAAYVRLPALPRTPNGKIDLRALPPPDAAEQGRRPVAPRSRTEEALLEIWREVLGAPQVGVEDPFFELGGHSLLLARVRARLRERLGVEVDMLTLLRHPTIRGLAAHLSGAAPDEPERRASPQARPDAGGSVAIVGMAGRFPGADDVDALWSLLLGGREGLTRAAADRPGLVPAAGMLADAAAFDAAFFGYSPRDAALMDPQHRVFLECAWTAMEDAGHAPTRHPGAVGVFGGCGAPRYWLQRVAPLAIEPGTAEDYRAMAGNGGDFLATRVAFKLGLRGPALTVQTACSTSLVAVHLACQSLRAGQCDLALAGGASIFSLDRVGYVAEEGGILSADGHCRPFDASAGGTVPASGVAVVALRRLEDALADGDTIHAVIRGSAINNDGGDRIGYTAPGVAGQAEVVALAHADAGVSADAIGLVEAHGTATPLGDPIEVAALTQAFQRGGAAVGACALGSLKGHLGHLDAAAGVTGLIKAALSLAREVIPGTLHFRRPSPALQLGTSPFVVRAEARAWPRGEEPRRAGVSAFGMGGTNAHAVLEEAPPQPASGPARPWQVLVLSARTPAALDAAGARLAEHLERAEAPALADVAFTLQRGRAAFEHRRAVVAATHADAAAALRDASRSARGRPGAPKLVFMFPGGGVQRPGMGAELYRHERVYRDALDRCAARFDAALGLDLRALLFPGPAELAAAARELERPSRNLAAIFATQVALTELLLAWGLRPAATTGHSLGEYSAAWLAGVLRLEDAADLVALRGELLDAIADAAMLIVPLSEAALAPRLGDRLALAAINAADSCVVSGPLADVEALRVALGRAGVEARRLPIATASHSPLVEPVAGRLAGRAASMALGAPRIPIVSNVSGGWLGDDDARDPGYWARHLRSTVRFADGLAALLADPEHVLVEVGPGKTLATLARAHPACGGRPVVTTLSHPGSERSDMEALLHALGRLWCAGAEVDWRSFTGEERRRRVRLPTYPFERRVHLLGAPEAATAPERPAPAPTKGATGEPADAVEVALAETWRALLGVDGVRPGDNFFDAGGSSLLAVQLRAEVKRRLAVQLPVHALLERPSFGGLLSALRALVDASPGRPPAARDDLMVCLQPGAAGRPPLFLVQPVGGTAYSYRELTRHLRPEQPVYAFRAPGMQPGEELDASVPAAAERCLAALRGVQPEGPWLLGGHSGGGVIAHELGARLAARGRVLVWMADSPAPAELRRLDVTRPEQVDAVLDAYRDLAPRAWSSLRAALDDDPRLRELVLASFRALAAYRPPRTAAEVVYLRAREQGGALDPHPEATWIDLADGAFTCHAAPGNHHTMLADPHAAALARIVQEHLDRFSGT